MLLATIKQALLAYRDPSSWQTLMRNGMSRDFSWGASAREYGKIYERADRYEASADAIAAAANLKRAGARLEMSDHIGTASSKQRVNQSSGCVSIDTNSPSFFPTAR